MPDSPVTLTNVMIGVYKLDLINVLSPICYTFLVGLIMEHNEHWFEQPLTMTTKQAMNAGGGDSRQTVYARRKILSTIRVKGEPLIKITPGNHAKNTATKYEINYNLLCCYNGLRPTSTDMMSNNTYSEPTHSLLKRDSSVYSDVTIPRSDQKREEKTSFSSVSNIINNMDLENLPAEKEKKGCEFEESRVGYVIMLGRDIWGEWVPQVNSIPMDEVEQIAEYPQERIDEAFKANALAMKDTHATHRPRRGSTRWVLNRLQDPERFGAPRVVTEEEKAAKSERDEADRLHEEEQERQIAERREIEEAKGSLDEAERQELRELAEAEVQKQEGIGKVGYMLTTLIAVKENELLRRRIDAKVGG